MRQWDSAASLVLRPIAIIGECHRHSRCARPTSRSDAMTGRSAFAGSLANFREEGLLLVADRTPPNLRKPPSDDAFAALSAISTSILQ